MKLFLINEESLNALIAYLSERPYKEVGQAIEVLKNLQQAKLEPAKEVVPDEKN